jgi:hypothetical protein
MTSFEKLIMEEMLKQNVGFHDLVKKAEYAGVTAEQAARAIVSKKPSPITRARLSETLGIPLERINQVIENGVT